MIVFVSSDATGKVTQHGLLAGNGRRKGTGLITEKILGFKVKWAGPVASCVMDRSRTVGDAREARESARRRSCLQEGESPVRTMQKKVAFLHVDRACKEARVPSGGQRNGHLTLASLDELVSERQ